MNLMLFLSLLIGILPLGIYANNHGDIIMHADRNNNASEADRNYELNADDARDERRLSMAPLRAFMKSGTSFLRRIILAIRFLEPELKYSACILKYFLLRYPNVFKGYEFEDISMSGLLMFFFRNYMSSVSQAMFSPNSQYAGPIKPNAKIGGLIANITNDDYYYYNSVIQNENFSGYLHNGSALIELSDLQPRRRRRHDYIIIQPQPPLRTAAATTTPSVNTQRHIQKTTAKEKPNERNNIRRNGTIVRVSRPVMMEIPLFDNLNTNRLGPSSSSSHPAQKTLEMKKFNTKRALDAAAAYKLPLYSSLPPPSTNSERTLLDPQRDDLKRYKRFMTYKNPHTIIEDKTDDLLKDFSFLSCAKIYFIHLVLRTLEGLIMT